MRGIAAVSFITKEFKYGLILGASHSVLGVIAEMLFRVLSSKVQYLVLCHIALPCGIKSSMGRGRRIVRV